MLYQTAILLHLLGATVWVGGHLLLAIRIVPKAYKSRDFTLINEFEKVYEPLGMPALLIQIITGIWLAFFYYQMPFLPSFSNPMERVIAIKLLLLLCTFALAIHARFFIIPKLNEKNLNLMIIHILLVTLIAVTMLFLGLHYRFGGI